MQKFYYIRYKYIEGVLRSCIFLNTMNKGKLGNFVSVWENMIRKILDFFPSMREYRKSTRKRKLISYTEIQYVNQVSNKTPGGKWICYSVLVTCFLIQTENWGLSFCTKIENLQFLHR